MQLSADELRSRAVRARAALEACVLCGHRCKVNRTAGETGRCRCGTTARVATTVLHPGEEPALGPLAGAVFFSHCNLSCVYCQNWQISQEDRGEEMEPAVLAERMLQLQEDGAANIELVSPTPWVPQILDTLAVAAERGLDLPVVYNTGGYDSPEALELLEGIVDVYLPDMRYSWGGAADRFSGAPDYPEVNRAAVLEMYRQVDDVVFDQDGRARRGLIVRLLVLPNSLAGVHNTLRWMADHLSKQTWFSLMAQYRPEHKAGEYLELARTLTDLEYRDLVDFADGLGFENFYTQAPDSRDTLRPDFSRDDPFAPDPADRTGAP
jgi:putative pyruvate formate lyase activating enzyme